MAGPLSGGLDAGKEPPDDDSSPSPLGPSPRQDRIKQLFGIALDRPPAERQDLLRAECGSDADLLAEVWERLVAYESNAEAAVTEGPYFDMPALMALLHQDGPGLPGPHPSPPPEAATQPLPAGADSSPEPAPATAPPLENAQRPLPQQIGRYRILSVLGAGGMGIVYSAEQPHPQRTVALKVLRPGQTTPAQWRRFEYEAAALARLLHPGVAQIYEAGIAETPDGPQPFFAMELVRGQCLTDYARTHHLDTRSRLALLARVCDAVQHAHQKGVIHRDLKPGNILVDDTGQPKILDFGVARFTDADIQAATRDTQPGQLRGTVPYMSPEQTLGDPHELDTRSDVYALGVVGYELLCEQLPYGAGQAPWDVVRSIREVDPRPLGAVDASLQGDIETIFAKALEKDRARRYASAGDFAADLRRYLANEPIVARPPSTAYQLRKWVSRHKVSATLVGLLVLLTVGAVITMSALYARAETARQVGQRDRELRDAANVWYLWELAMKVPTFASQSAEPAPDPAEVVPPGPPEEMAVAHYVLGARYLAAGHPADAEEHLREALRRYRDLYRDEHPSVVATLAYLVESMKRQSRHDEALQLVSALLAEHSGRDTADRLSCVPLRLSLARIYTGLARFDEAAIVLRQVLATSRELLGETHPVVLRHTRFLNDALIFSGDYEQGEALARVTLDIERRIFGEANLNVLLDRQYVIGCLWLRGQYADAERELRDILRIGEALYGDDPVVIDTRNSLGVALRDAGRYAEAEVYLRAAVGRPSTYGSPEMNLAKLLYFTGRVEEAESLLITVLDWRHANLAPGHPDIAEPLLWLGLICVERGDLDQADDQLQEALDLRSARLHPDHWLVGEARSALGACRTAQGRYAEAEQLLLDGHRIVQSRLTDQSRMTQQCAERLARLYQVWPKPP